MRPEHRAELETALDALLERQDRARDLREEYARMSASRTGALRAVWAGIRALAALFVPRKSPPAGESR